MSSRDTALAVLLRKAEAKHIRPTQQWRERGRTIVGPQVDFDDLYSAVYAVIDDAKTRHRVVKLYKGSHGSADPHPAVLDFGTFFAAERRGVLGFACQAVRPSADRSPWTI